MLIIQTIDNTSSDGEFAEEILSDLIAEGLSGQDLLDEFKTRQTKVRSSILAMLQEAKAVAQGSLEYAGYEDIFGDED